MKGCGVECLEGYAGWHYGNLDDATTKEVLEEIEKKRPKEEVA